MADTTNRKTIGIDVLSEKIDDLRREWREWREEVYRPAAARARDDVSEDRAGRLRTADDLALSDAAKWEANEKAHKEIIDRLDSLNGWKNKVMGIMSVIGFSAPIGVAIWALVTRT